MKPTQFSVILLTNKQINSRQYNKIAKQDITFQQKAHVKKKIEEDRIDIVKYI